MHNLRNDLRTRLAVLRKAAAGDGPEPNPQTALSFTDLQKARRIWNGSAQHDFALSYSTPNTVSARTDEAGVTAILRLFNYGLTTAEGVHIYLLFGLPARNGTVRFIRHHISRLFSVSGLSQTGDQSAYADIVEFLPWSYFGATQPSATQLVSLFAIAHLPVFDPAEEAVLNLLRKASTPGFNVSFNPCRISMKVGSFSIPMELRDGFTHCTKPGLVEVGMLSTDAGINADFGSENTRWLTELKQKPTHKILGLFSVPSGIQQFKLFSHAGNEVVARHGDFCDLSLSDSGAVLDIAFEDIPQLGGDKNDYVLRLFSV